MDARYYPSIPAKKLKTDILSTDYTFKLRDIKWYTGSDGVDVDFTSVIAGLGNVGYGVFEPNTPRQEFFTYDPTNMATATTTGLTILSRGLPWGSDYTTEDATRKFGHASGATMLLFTNAPAFYDQFVNKNNDETIAGTWTFTSTARPVYNTHPTFSADEELIDKKYADDLAIAGAPDSSETVKGVVESATQTEVDQGDNSGTTTAPTVVRPAQLAAVIQKGAYTYAADAAGSDTYAVTLTPVPAAYVTGMNLNITVQTANTGAATLNVNSLGAKDIKKYVNGAIADLETNDLLAGMPAELFYDGTQFILTSTRGTDITSAVAFEAQTFFGTTDITGSEAETLTDGSDASLLHNHGGYFASQTLQRSDVAVGSARATSNVGFSDAATPLISSIGAHNVMFTFGIADDYGIVIYPFDFHDNSSVSADFLGCVRIGSDDWASRATNTIRKNAGDGSFVSGGAHGPLAHDPTNSYLLMLTSTTNIRRFSGIAGTALTQVDNITLDTAVTVTAGFVYDDTNQRYICLDETSNLVRRFNSSGTTIDTATYTVNDTFVVGLVFINDRIHLVALNSTDSVDTGGSTLNATSCLTFIPTTMIR